MSDSRVDFANDYPIGFAVATTEDGLATLKRIRDPSEHGIEIFEVPAILADDAAIIRLLPLAEQGLADAITAFDEAEQIEKNLSGRLRGKTGALQAAAERLRQTLETAVT